MEVNHDHHRDDVTDDDQDILNPLLLCVGLVSHTHPILVSQWTLTIEICTYTIITIHNVN